MTEAISQRDPGHHALVMTGPFSYSHKDTVAGSFNDIRIASKNRLVL
jgi:hypothetical protein